VTVSQKAALSLLISVVVIAGFSVLAFTGFFDLLETRFYNPSIANSQIREIDRDARIIQDFLTELEKSFSDTLDNDAVKRSFLPNQSAQDIFERTRIYGLLLESQKGLQSVRFVDSGGLRIHFSTNPGDILSQDEGRIAYRNYTDLSPFSPYDELAVPDQGLPKLTLDQRNDRIVFSFPFYDSLDVYRGTALYSLSIRAVADMLITAGRLKVGEDLSLVSVPADAVSGMVSGMSVSDKSIIIPVISSAWSEGIIGLNALDSENSPSSLVLVSAKTETGLFIGRVLEERIFAFPNAMKLILLGSLFLTLYLSIFLCFNLRADTVTVIQNRLKNLELSLIREYYERKGEMDWNHWYRELENRREDVRTELKRGIKTKNAPALMEDIDVLINKSWDEILTAIGGKRETRLAIDEDKLQNILNRVLLAAGTSPVLPGGGVPQTLTVPVVQQAVKPATTKAAEGDEAVEEAEALEEAEAVEEIEAADEVEALEEVEAADEAEALEEVEAVEEIEAADEVGALEEIEEVNALEKVEVLEEAEAFDEAEAVEEVEAAEEVEALEEVEAVDEAETVDEVEALDEAEAVEEIEALDEVEALEEIEAADEVEALDEAETVDEVEAVDEAETIDEAEAVKDISEIKVIEASDLEELEEAGKPEEPVLSADEIADVETELASQSRKKSNIQLVFGDDDIPYIVESSGLELVDDDIVSAMSNVSAEDEIGELEELDDDELGELGEPGTENEPGEEPAPVSEAPAGPAVLEDIASRIEFSETGEDADEEEIDGELEIVSPFATMLSRFDDDGVFRIAEDDDSTEKIKTSGRLEELNAEGMSLIYKPFQNEEVQSPELIDSSGPAGTIIEERDGVNYVNEIVKSPDEETEKSLDPSLKNLVNAVIKKP
jgi:hypothetical protein